jgi:transcriptional regulator GlxA family with amidase domain
MLRDTTLPISEVAERTGFGDATNFGRAFRKSVGQLPSEYRKCYCWLLQ